MKKESNVHYRFAMLLVLGVALLFISGCQTLPDGSVGIPEGTVFYSPGDPNAWYH